MESKPNFMMTGIIQGKTKDSSKIKEYTQPTLNSIITEISKKFPSKNNFIYIYHRYNKKNYFYKFLPFFFVI